MRLKKLICLGLSLVMVLSATAGCGGATGAATAGVPAAQEAAAEPAADSAGEKAEAAQEAAPEAQEAAAETSAETPAEASEPAAASAGEEIAQGDISVTWDDSRIYPKLTLGRYKTVTTYGVKGYEDVPFLKVTDYMDVIAEGKQKITFEDGGMKISLNGAEAVIDPEADTITIDNPSRFRSSGDIDGAVMEDVEYNVVTPSVKNESAQTEVKPLTISLKDYNMPVVAYEDDILMPFLAMQNTFGAVIQKNLLGYNGKDYYNAFDANYFASDPNHAGAKDSPYLKSFYNGPFSTKTETTQAYADYGYYSICLLLDLTFGHKKEKNITTFDEYFTRLNAKESMCSTDPSAAMTAEMILFYYLFDSAHDALIGVNNVFGIEEQVDASQVGEIADQIKESEEGKELFEEEKEKTEELSGSPYDVILGALFEKGFRIPDVVPLYIWSSYFDSTKPEDYGEQRLDYAGDTAVIFFDKFKDNSPKRAPSYYLDPIKEEDDEESSFAFFYHCFEDIKQHDEVENVVINVSDNGGGAAAALIAILGFLSEDGEVRITNQDLLAGNYREECYHVDTNLDGIADDQDGYGGQYDFFIMSSGSSYSCANALPYFAQQEGVATIIGVNPGGGDCFLGYFIDAYGRFGCYSSFLKLGQEEVGGFISDEKATQVDLNMMPSITDIMFVPWYDAEGIADAVHQYKDGATEIEYEEKGEIISGLLTDLLGSITEFSEESMEGATEAAAVPAGN